MKGSAILAVTTACLRWLARSLLLAFALLLVGALAVIVVLPRATHGSALTVLTGSMTPEIPVGSVVVVRPVDPSTLEVGDVATYQKEPGQETFITHRITEIDTTTSPTSFTFKGDANRGPDVDPVPAGAIRGEVWFHVPYLGAIRDALHGKGGITLVAMLALAGYALSQLSGGLKERKSAERSLRSPDHPLAAGTILKLDRALIRATFDPARVFAETAMSPQAAAEHWSGLLVGSDAHSFTVLVAPPPDGAVAAAELLMYLDPISIEVCEPPNAIVGARAAAEMRALLDTSRTVDEQTGSNYAVG
jgi:signal peptidase I